MTTEPHEIHKIVQDALKALKRGDRTTARGLAMSAARLAPNSEEPWLVLAAVSGPEESLDYIQKALQINPESVPAQHALEWALKQRADWPPAPEAEPPAAASERPTGPVARTERTAGPGRSHRSHPQDVLPGEPHPGAPEAGQQKRSLPAIRRLLLLGIGLGILVCLALLALWFGRPLLGGLGQAAPALGPSAEAPAIFVPTPDCGPPTLVLGSATFQIEPLAAPADGSLPLAPGASEVAYWVEGTDKHRFFVLGPTPGTFSVLPEMTFENTASVTWSDCNSTTYSLSSPEAGSLNALTRPDQSAPGITVFFQSDAAGNGFVLHGELSEEQIRVFDTPDTTSTEVQAEIGLLRATASPDGATLQVEVSVLNYGGSAFTVTADDVALASEGTVAIQPLDSRPSLPWEVRPGATETFTFSFPRPPTPTAALNILGVEYELEGY